MLDVVPPKQPTKDAVEVEMAVLPAVVAADEEATEIVGATGEVSLLATIVVSKDIFLVIISYQDMDPTGQETAAGV